MACDLFMGALGAALAALATLGALAALAALATTNLGFEFYYICTRYTSPSERILFRLSEAIICTFLIEST